MARRRWWALTRKTNRLPDKVTLGTHGSLYSGLRHLDKAGAQRDEIAASVARARAACEHEFSFLGQTVSFDDAVRWHDPRVSQLWRYHLHYFDYAQDLMIWGATHDQDARAYAGFRDLALSWIDQNQTLVGDGWHPYTISLRVVNWLNALLVFTKQTAEDRDAAQLILRSAYAQTRILFSNLEFDVRGNHLLENLRALIWAGSVFSGPEARRWFETGLRLLEIEVREQILSDGGHFERSPGYHVVVFKRLLEIAIWLRRNAVAPQWIEDALRRMSQFLWNILPLSGQAPLLKDSTWDMSAPPCELLQASAAYFQEFSFNCDDEPGFYAVLLFGREAWRQSDRWPRNSTVRSSVAMRPSGYFVIRDDERSEHLIFDAGKTCPDYLPAHAHADALSYELSVANQRIVVDSGVYEYAAGGWRDYFRSTRAHNTVEINHENQSEVWGSFRVGRRAHPGPVFWQADESSVLVQGEHDGYCRSSVPVIHQRTIFAVYGELWIVADQLWGSGQTDLENHIHLHPDLELEQLSESTWKIKNSRAALWVTGFGYDRSSIVVGQAEPFRQGWYSEVFGSVKAAPVLTLSLSGTLPVAFGYVIARDAPANIKLDSSISGHEITVTAPSRDHRLILKRQEPPRAR
jgi:uncharacterized heparinase superfamily protein